MNECCCCCCSSTSGHTRVPVGATASGACFRGRGMRASSHAQAHASRARGVRQRSRYVCVCMGTGLGIAPYTMHLTESPSASSSASASASPSSSRSPSPAPSDPPSPLLQPTGNPFPSLDHLRSSLPSSRAASPFPDLDQIPPAQEEHHGPFENLLTAAAGKLDTALLYASERSHAALDDASHRAENAPALRGRTETASAVISGVGMGLDGVFAGVSWMLGAVLAGVGRGIDHGLGLDRVPGEEGPPAAADDAENVLFSAYAADPDSNQPLAPGERAEEKKATKVREPARSPLTM